VQHTPVTFSYKQKTNSTALSPQANYTDWATATCRRNLVPTFVDIGVFIQTLVRIYASKVTACL
jgi:hypothetical protein